MSAIFDEDTQHVDPLTGELLVGGFIYIGEPGVDPVLNPKDIFDNREETGLALAQPQVIGSNGRATNKMWTTGKYSLRIEDSANVLKYEELQNGFDENVGNIQTTNSLGVNDITCTGNPVQSSYVDNKAYIVTAPADNTGAMTINIDSIGVKSIRKGHDQLLVSGDVKADMKLVLVYNSTDDWMELQSAVLGSVFGGSIQVGQDIVITEQADHSSTPAAGFGYVWVKNDAPSSLYFTDDAGTDFELSKTFSGALVYQSANQSLNDNNTPTTITFDTESYDTDSIHDLVTNTERLTVPSGVSKVKVNGQVGLLSLASSGNAINLSVRKNGASLSPSVGESSVTDTTTTGTTYQVNTGVINVSASDYLTLVIQVTGTHASLTTSASGTWFSMEIVE